MNTLVSHFKSILKNKKAESFILLYFFFENKYLILHMNFSLSFPLPACRKWAR